MGTKISALTAGTAAGTDEIPANQSGTTKKLTALAVSKLAIDDAITNGVTDRAPAQNAVFDALALKAASVHTHVKADITDLTQTSLWSPTTVLYHSDYANLQAAVDAAELLGAAATFFGVTIFIAPGDHSAQDVTIKKNVNLVGLTGSLSVDGKPTKIGDVTVRPVSNVSSAVAAKFQGLQMLSFLATSDAGGASYNPASPLVYLNDCFSADVELDRIAKAQFVSCDFGGASLAMALSEDVTFRNCGNVTLEWRSDDSAASLPGNYSGGNLQFHNCVQVSLDLFRDDVAGATITAYFAAYATHFSLLRRNGESEVRMHASSVETYTLLNANNTNILWDSMGTYEPTTSADWDTPPKFITAALDELAARVKALELL